MKRPSTLEEFIRQASRLTAPIEFSRYGTCTSCSDKYDNRLSDLTDNYCLDCAREIYYGDSSGSVKAVLSGNIKEGDKQKRLFNSRPEAQRKGMGKTGG